MLHLRSKGALEKKFLIMKAVAAALALVFSLGHAAPVTAAADKIAVVAAENFYGDIARQIGGDRTAVVSIMNNPEQDPHLFETTPATVRQIAGAQLVIRSEERRVGKVCQTRR